MGVWQLLHVLGQMRYASWPGRHNKNPVAGLSVRNAQPRATPFTKNKSPPSLHWLIGCGTAVGAGVVTSAPAIVPIIGQLLHILGQMRYASWPGRHNKNIVAGLSARNAQPRATPFTKNKSPPSLHWLIGCGTAVGAGVVTSAPAMVPIIGQLLHVLGQMRCASWPGRHNKNIVAGLSARNAQPRATPFTKNKSPPSSHWLSPCETAVGAVVSGTAASAGANVVLLAVVTLVGDIVGAVVVTAGNANTGALGDSIAGAAVGATVIVVVVLPSRVSLVIVPIVSPRRSLPVACGAAVGAVVSGTAALAGANVVLLAVVALGDIVGAVVVTVGNANTGALGDSIAGAAVGATIIVVALLAVVIVPPIVPLACGAAVGANVLLVAVIVLEGIADAAVGTAGGGLGIGDGEDDPSPCFPNFEIINPEVTAMPMTEKTINAMETQMQIFFLVWAEVVVLALFTLAVVVASLRATMVVLVTPCSSSSPPPSLPSSAAV